MKYTYQYNFFQFIQIICLCPQQDDNVNTNIVRQWVLLFSNKLFKNYMDTQKTQI